MPAHTAALPTKSLPEAQPSGLFVCLNNIEARSHSGASSSFAAVYSSLCTLVSWTNLRVRQYSGQTRGWLHSLEKAAGGLTN